MWIRLLASFKPVVILQLAVNEELSLNVYQLVPAVTAHIPQEHLRFPLNYIKGNNDFI